MKPVLALVALWLMLASTPAGAEDALGRVEAIYQEVARGVLVHASRRHSASGHRWADVALDGRFRLVRVPSELDLAVGDTVRVRLGEPKSSPLARILPASTVSRALEVVPEAERLAGGR